MRLGFKRFIGIIIMVLGPKVSQSQIVVPNEYIIQWSNDEAAQQFYTSSLENRSNSNSYHRRILTNPLCIDVVKLDDDQAKKILPTLRKNPGVVYIQENRIIEQRAIPDDPQFAQQWQYINNGVGGVANADLDMDLAWDITKGGTTSSGDTIVVCVIDEGINIDHPDLQGNLWINKLEISNNGIDDDLNGYIDDHKGWNITTNNDDLSEGGSHGTPVSGIVGAKGNNGIGVSGVNWNVKVMFVKYGSATEANALASYAYAYTMRKIYNETNGSKGAFVVATNASWGINDLFAKDAPIWCQMYDLLGEVGVLSCGATTNRDVNVDISGDMPTTCESPFLISVTNMNRSDLKLTGAGYGAKSIDLGAYGHQAFTLSRTGYAAFGGTSGATPHVAGTIALMYSVPCTKIQQLVKSNPSSAALIVRDMLLHGVVDNPSLKTITTTEGRLNTHRAIQNMESLCLNCAPPAGMYIKEESSNARIFWENDNIGQIGLRYRKVGKTNWELVPNIQLGHELVGLDFCTEYELQLSSSCGLLPTQYSYSLYFYSGGCCPKPEAFHTTYIERDLVLDWTFNETSDFQHEIKVTDILGNTHIYHVDSNQLIIKDIDECQWFSVDVLSHCTLYNTFSQENTTYILHSDCGSCTDTSYCTFSKKNTKDEWIQKVQFGELSNDSGINQNGYGNYMGVGISLFNPDSVYVLSITPGFSAGAFTEHYNVFIDFNQNSVFEASERMVNQKTSSASGITNNIQIPGDALLGTTRMRIIMAFQNHDEPCDQFAFEYGEIEDYCIEISTRQINCVLNGGVTIDSASENSILVSFDTLNRALSYLVLYKKENQINYDSIFVGGSPFLLSGLDSCKKYSLKIAPDCGLGDLIFTLDMPFVSPCRTTTNQNEKRKKILVFPNPSNESFTVETLEYNIDQIYVTTVLGEVVDIKIEKENDKFFIVWPSSIPKGMYLLILTFQSETFISKIVKQ
ncbi:MAG: S8 family serine peptidase [Saprospiraceae bacterium]